MNDYQGPLEKTFGGVTVRSYHLVVTGRNYTGSKREEMDTPERMSVRYMSTQQLEKI
jgi:hypothetical protein